MKTVNMCRFTHTITAICCDNVANAHLIFLWNQLIFHKEYCKHNWNYTTFLWREFYVCHCFSANNHMFVNLIGNIYCQCSYCEFNVFLCLYIFQFATLLGIHIVWRTCTFPTSLGGIAHVNHYKWLEIWCLSVL